MTYIRFGILDHKA